MAKKSLEETTRWYQTILQVCAGSPELHVNGVYGTNTKQALVHFQKLAQLPPKGILDVPTNLALTQVALEWLYHEEINNPLGKRFPTLRDRIKQFQADNGLSPDGKVGPSTREVMVRTLQAERPITQPNGKGYTVVSAKRANMLIETG